ncbi:MAG: helix-turn-helix domain-containing protein [Patescibacteria group bacterium]
MKPFKPLNETLDAVERDEIKLALREAGYDCKSAAELLSVTEKDLSTRMARLGVTPLGPDDDLREHVKAARKRIESELVRKAMLQSKADVTAAAKLLKISRKGLRMKIREYEVSFPLHLMLHGISFTSKPNQFTAVERQAVRSAMECAHNEVNFAARLLAVELPHMLQLVNTYPST